MALRIYVVLIKKYSRSVDLGISMKPQMNIIMNA